MGLKIRPRRFGSTIAKMVAVVALVVQPLYTVVVSQIAAADSGTIITNVSELRSAIENQADGQTWTVEPGIYGLAAFSDITVSGQTGWYFPITANNLTINGVGNPTIYGTGFTANGNWATQNLVSVFGNNVTIDGLTFMPKVEPNKTIEVLGSDFTLRNTTIAPNTLTDPSEYNGISDPQDRQDEKDWGGSLYFSHAGNHTVENVTIKNSGVSFRYAPSGTHITFTNVKLDYATPVDWINGYRYSSGFNNVGNSITGAPSIVYHVNSTLNNLDTVLSKTQNGDTIDLDSDLIVSHQATLTKTVTLNGNGYTISPNFAKTDNDNNSAIGVQANGVTINNLVEDGTNGTNLHGINIFAATGVALNDVTVKNNDRSGVNVNGSTVTVNNITTSGNGWHGIDVDKAGAVLTVNGVSHHTESVPQIYVDNTGVGQVVDTNHQYSSKDNVLQAGDRVYGLKPGVPTLLTPANNGYIATNDFYFDWTDVSGAAEYEFQSSQNPATAGGVLTTGVWNNKANGGPDRNHLTDSNIHSYGANGTWYWQVRAIDANGVTGDWSPVWKMTIDMAAPTAPTNLGWKTSTNVAVPNGGATSVYDGTASWQDSSSDVDHYIYKYWNDIVGNPYKIGSEYVTTTGATSLYGVFNQGEGVHHFCVAAVDHAGNTSACTAFTITYNTTAPATPSLLSPANNAIVGGASLTNSWTGVTGAHHYVYQSFNDAGATSLRFQSNYTTTSKTATNVADTTFWWRVKAVDAAGNESGWSPLWKVTIDNTPPAVSLSDYDTTSNTVTPNIAASDANNPLAYHWAPVDAASAANVDISDPNVLRPDFTVHADGTYTFNLITTDPAGNATTKVFSFTYETPQTPSVDQGNSGSNTTDTTTFSSPVSTALAVTNPTDGGAFTAVALNNAPSTNGGSTPGVLGAESASKTSGDSDKDVLGTTSTPENAASGWAWYWWVPVAVGIAGFSWWLVAALRRHRSGDDV